ncbi:MAG: thioredoxin domain-containing protein [Terrimesophilobacter sp.]
MPNMLADALSPYLRQHAGNPVDWQQWGPEPFAEAARRDVPVFVSIGYSTCHWCHVMARESFSDPSIAAVLNANFVSIKVDREEHPEVDSSYLTAASAFSQNLGWPLNVFVTPQGKTFFAGTYWPPDAMVGHPSFRQVLEGVSDAWAHRRSEVEANAADVAAAIRGHAAHPDGALPDRAELDGVVKLLGANEDQEFGGFGTAPKFPMVPVLDFLLEHGSPESCGLADRALTAMATSGLRDAVEGGFFRYATHRDWTEPHFERMLYDNAGLLKAYSLLAARVPERAALARQSAEGIVNFLLRTMRLPGGFASAQNSESIVDGHLTEGDYYSLNEKDRAQQEPPALDAKVLTGWNGLAIGALASAGHYFGREDWLDAARDAADTILVSQMKESGELARATLAGKPSTARATLEDYGLLARGLLHLAQSTGEVRWAASARQLVDACITSDGFAIPGGGDPVLAAFGIDPDTDPTEGALPSGASALADASRQLYLLTGDSDYLRQATGAMEKLATIAMHQPLGFGSALAVMTALAAAPTQLVVVADETDSALSVAARGWVESGGVSVTVTASGATEWAAEGFELFEGRSLQGGQPTAYLCSDFVCRLPVTDVASFLALRVGS